MPGAGPLHLGVFPTRALAPTIGPLRLAPSAAPLAAAWCLAVGVVPCVCRCSGVVELLRAERGLLLAPNAATNVPARLARPADASRRVSGHY